MVLFPEFQNARTSVNCWDRPTEKTLRVLVEKYLGLYLHTNATFLAERLYALNQSQENLYILSTCYIQAGQFHRAYRILQKGMDLQPDDEILDVAAQDLHVKLRYLLAQCCFELGNLREAEGALLEGTNVAIQGPQKCIEQILDNCRIPNGAAGLYLLGLICTRDNRREHAVTYFALALTLDPFLWDAYEQLCAAGVDIGPSAFFGSDFKNDGPVEFMGNGGIVLRESPSTDDAATVPIPVPVPGGEYLHVSGFRVSRQVLPTGFCFPHSSTDSGSGDRFEWSSKYYSYRDTSRDEILELRGGSDMEVQHQQEQQQLQQQQESVRRSSRRLRNLDNSSKEDTEKVVNIDAENQYSHQNNQMAAPSSSPVKPLQASMLPPVAAPSQNGKKIAVDDIAGSLNVLDLLRKLGEGIILLNQYQCTEALEAFENLPKCQQETGWVAHQKGKSCFEIGDYRRAKEEFQQMREVAPDRTAGLEVYSTVLWHLKEEVELCYLAQQALEIDKKSPESWCVIGNCFSLQKEHDVAIKFFQRALQVDKYFCYGLTLSGHEFVSNEDFEKAISCYRSAITISPRHYKAWYGLGTIYYRQEKYDLAEYHFRRAISVNPRSSVLYCYLGMVLHANQKCDEALNMLQRASDLEPSNPQAKFQRALVLRTMECYEAALEELQAVRDFAPRESSVFFLMGKICKQLGRTEEALLFLNTALDLDPKDSNLIKLAIDKLDSPDMDENDDL